MRKSFSPKTLYQVWEGGKPYSMRYSDKAEANNVLTGYRAKEPNRDWTLHEIVLLDLYIDKGVVA